MEQLGKGYRDSVPQRFACIRMRARTPPTTSDLRVINCEESTSKNIQPEASGTSRIDTLDLVQETARRIRKGIDQLPVEFVARALPLCCGPRNKLDDLPRLDLYPLIRNGRYKIEEPRIRMDTAKAFRIATLEPVDVITDDGLSQVISDFHTGACPRQRECNVGAKSGEKQVFILTFVLSNFTPQKPQMGSVRGPINDLK